jgi:uncharacterized membrane protein HdeD (DUF308 family)
VELMNEPKISVLDDILVRSWWLIALRGVAALVFGLITLFQPALGLVAMVLLFGTYALADGLLKIWSAIAHRRDQPHWVATLAGGLLGVAAGLVAFFWPGITALSLLFVIAAWAIITGVTEIATALRLRKTITGEWALAGVGVLSILFGVLIAAFPGAGALAVALWIGVYATVIGVLLLVVGFSLLSWGREHHVIGEHRAA